ncbi:unnamed protein product, partial [Mesorhabditis belari]|uniref:Major facilitator superfamily (MFS) profile domain-containing protein n=1 Tax=Mesorhabditis belari TaxID=2138241 RepID=A0AAF3EPY0_9BILA
MGRIEEFVKRAMRICLQPSWHIHMLALALCLSSGFHQGYIAAVLNQPYKEIEAYIKNSWLLTTGHELSDTTKNLLWSLLNVTFPVATIVGQFAAPYLCKRYGRKKTALISTFLYIPGGIISFIAKFIPPAFELLYVGRFIWSFANGLNSVVATVWIVECAPPKIRGRMASMQEMFMSIGSLATQAAGVPFSTDQLWPLVFVPGIIASVIAMFMFIFVYDAPASIIEKEGDLKKARKSLATYYGVEEDDPSLDEEMAICEKRLQKKAGNGVKAEHDGLTIIFMPWKAKDDMSKVIRHAAWLGLFVKVLYVFTGARALRAYSTFLLSDLAGWSKDSAIWGSFAIGVARVPVTLICMFLVDRVGRRPLMNLSTVICVLSLAVMLVATLIGGSMKIATLIALAALLLISAMGIGAISRFYAAELVPRSLLINATSYLTMIEALAKIGVEFAFYPLGNAIGGWSILIFLVPTLISLPFLWYMCPETSGKHVNEVLDEMAIRKNLKVKFTS